MITRLAATFEWYVYLFLYELGIRFYWDWLMDHLLCSYFGHIWEANYELRKDIMSGDSTNFEMWFVKSKDSFSCRRCNTWRNDDQT